MREESKYYGKQSLIRRQLKSAYADCTLETLIDRTEALALKLDYAGSKAISERIDELHKLCKQRAMHLRHLHLARAMLSGVDYARVEATANLDNAGWRGPNAQYIADIINGMCTDALVSVEEITDWLLAGTEFELVMAPAHAEAA